MFLNLQQNIRETRKRAHYNVQHLLPLHTDLYLSSFNCKDGASLNTFRALILSGFPILIDAIEVAISTVKEPPSSFHVSYRYIVILIFYREFVPV